MPQNTDNRGQWQAQGNDVPKPGHCEPWNEPAPPTKTAGLALLDQVRLRCGERQRSLRAGAFKEAERYVGRLPADGLPGFMMKTFHVRSPPTNARKARVDLEVTSGRAFVSDDSAAANAGVDGD